MKDKYPKWTEQEIQTLIELYPANHNSIIAIKLNRTISALKTKADDLKLRKNHSGVWTDNQIQRLIELYPDTDNDVIAKEFSKSKQSIASMAHKLSLKKNGHKWTEDEIQKLIELYPNTHNIEIANQLNKSIKSIGCKAHKLFLKKSTEHISAHIAKRNKMVGRDITYQLAKEQALLYKSRAEFQVQDSSCYQIARRNGYLDEICSHMIKISFSIPQLILRDIMDKLLKSKASYNNRKIIKPYELDLYYPEWNLGFEYNGKGWHATNSNDEIKNKLCKDKNITLITIVENNIRYEDDVKLQLISNISLINTITNLSLSVDNIKNLEVSNIFEQIYDKNGLIKLAKSYESYKQFRKEHINEYNKIIKLKLLEEATSHMIDKPRWHTKESVINIVSKYKYLGDLIKEDVGVYGYIKKNKLNYLIDHLTKRNRYD